MYLYIIVRSVDPEVHLVRCRFPSSVLRSRFLFPTTSPLLHLEMVYAGGVLWELPADLFHLDNCDRCHLGTIYIWGASI